MDEKKSEKIIEDEIEVRKVRERRRGARGKRKKEKETFFEGYSEISEW